MNRQINAMRHAEMQCIEKSSADKKFTFERPSFSRVQQERSSSMEH
ncbi:MAG: hypothetical protein LBD40_04000 [Puniceicoccales bacterium]|nr:hypothetical protein [Puniceicoccales bacterium]